MSVSTEKISVIMPVYNTPEKYIQVSVDSVLKQTYRNIELIIVDDGSERACAEYCDTLAQKDIRIKVIHKNNSGVSSARNIGTESATGSYVMYMDSDDILKNTAIQQGVRVIAKTEADFVFAGLQHISDYNSFLSRQDNNREVLEFTLYQEEEIDKIRRAFLALRDKDFLNIRGKGFVNRGPYARLIKKDIATKVKFNERLKIGEDVEWNMRLLNECSIVCFIKSIWYGYLIYQNSSLRKYYGNRSKLLEEYHRTLYKQNRAFCNKHLDDYTYNVVVSYYMMVKYEYLSEQNLSTEGEKNKEIQCLLKKFPWNLMLDKHLLKNFPLRYKAFVFFCRIGFALPLLRFLKRLKGQD